MNLVRNSKRQLKLLMLVPFLILIFDFTIGAFDDKTFVILAQDFVLILILSFALLRERIIVNRPAKWLLALLIFILITIPFSSDSILSGNMFAKFALSSLFYIYGYNSINNNKNFLKFVNYLIAACILNYLYYLYASIFQIGTTAYHNQIMYIGYQSYASQFIFPIAVITILSFHRFIMKKIHIYYYLFIGITIFVMILSFRRTNFVILFLGLFFLITKFKNFKIIFYRLIPVLLLFLFIGWDTVEEIVVDNLQSRERITRLENYYEEGRFIENIAVINTISISPLIFIFGTGEMWNSVGKYGFYSGDQWTWKRGIHNDYGNLLFGGGVFALMLYLGYLLSLYNFRSKNIRHDNPFIKTLSNYALFLIFIFFINGFSSGLTDIFYRSMMSILLGGASKLMIIHKTNK